MVGGPDQSQAHRLADLLADPLAEVLGRPVTVEHVPGEDGIAAARAVMKGAGWRHAAARRQVLLLAVNAGDRSMAAPPRRASAGGQAHARHLGCKGVVVAPASDVAS